MLQPRNPETISDMLADRAIELFGDDGIHMISRVLEQLCNKQLVNKCKSHEARNLAHQARDYAGNVRKLAEKAREIQQLVDTAN
jgi:hypothetical protein